MIGLAAALFALGLGLSIRPAVVAGIRATALTSRPARKSGANFIGVKPFGCAGSLYRAVQLNARWRSAIA